MTPHHRAFGLRPSFGLRISAFGIPPRLLFLGAMLALALRPDSLLACAACYGASDSPMAQGMNWGIFSLLGFIALVLGGVIAFFVYLARRAAAVAAQAAEPLLPLMDIEHGLE
jgi:heme/copper-type cytochrome/quinol oxidase subunit 2